MPQPTIPAAVMIEQYCPFTQRLLMPIAVPFSKVNSRLVERGSLSVMSDFDEQGTEETREL